MVNDLKRGPDAKPKIKQRRRGNFSSYERSDKHDLSDKNKKKTKKNKIICLNLTLLDKSFPAPKQFFFFWKLTKLKSFQFPLVKLGWASQLASPSTLHLIFSLDSVGKSNFWIPSLNLTFLSNTFGYFQPLLVRKIRKNFIFHYPNWKMKNLRVLL